ncbi:hypothetical protein Fmac_004382 [Flemingia macrophylla]|uniref:F-box domain-containing protein n=1 Tax=Flemingia macrophylla TaxID=520843 RepID=A0ABD1N5P3_9FABA
MENSATNQLMPEHWSALNIFHHFTDPFVKYRGRGKASEAFANVNGVVRGGEGELVIFSILVDEGENITGDLSNIEPFSPNGVLDLSIKCLLGEPIPTCGVINECKAHPHLHIAHVSCEVLPLLAHLQLLQRSTQPVNDVPNFLYVVFHGRVLPRLQPLEPVAICHECLCRLIEHRLNKRLRILLDARNVHQSLARDKVHVDLFKSAPQRWQDQLFGHSHSSYIVSALVVVRISVDSSEKEKDSGFVGEFALGNMSIGIEGFLLKALPQDILVQVLCGVDHEVLKQVFHVSKTIREATLIVKDLHFEYSTPKKKTFYFLPAFDLENAESSKSAFDKETKVKV